ncbi:Phosphohydrolase (MutT/nudix family protein) [Roseomonas mucosa]|uniref:ADP-ribose pyrophosphatase n=2 Tax=Roseomonas mucosa TaxID=207340 RepID=A0A1S8CZJ9_9PROT|nr:MULTISPECIES: NUDIX hydrolase [Roseomonas]MBS5902945.1 NUDIX hydrolase [Acetobacteraceae bacterium]AWV24367.1 Phosphohydrolase (MutT/nudix family protein) [Roseomonas mucosa]MCG7354204.1 NUDIX hydrolase [Roseomonas mucosa]MDT8274906.1 NUDIX hydrolase [Roseomonas mucosa]MDT8292183.1 NUDIX hydrolase [Roseomonas mucosa]
MTRKPWTVRRSRTVLKDRWIHVNAEAVEDARGNLLDPFYTFEYPDWVHVVALTPSDELVLIRQYRHGAQDFCLELPAGGMDPGETDPVPAGARELLEETGYAAGSLRLVSSLSPNPASHRNRSHNLLALDVRKIAEPRLEPGEDITVELHPWQDVLARLDEGILPQVMHVSALLLCLRAAGRLRF